MRAPIQTAETICVGTELLIGHTLNTNSHFVARQLSLMGINSYYQTVVGDNPDRLLAAIRSASTRSDCVFLTGGLGPTADDITMAVAARAADRNLTLHEPSRQAILEIFTRMGREMTDNNLKQAMLPDQSIVLPNRNGTAPGCIIEFEQDGADKTLILLPGPPSELRPMFLEQVKPYLVQRTSRILRNTFVRMIGIGESKAETVLKDLIDSQTNPTIAPYAGEGEVMFRITQLAQSHDDPDNTGPLLEEVTKRAGEYIYEVGERKMHEVVADLLVERHATLSMAESCTAGLAQSMLGEIPGASRFLTGGLVAYANEVKREMLGVPAELLEREGAVSEACAIAMADGCRLLFGTDYAVGITGIAGPDGGTPEKPVGLVHLAVSDANGCETRVMRINGNRARVRGVAALNAFDLLRRRILG
ncbi:MAG: competence/damage-inducible protein A [Clostridiaceae bacterium]|nr:competence/damage-inducible protein A [Clostridiaceae bacterium]